MKKIVIGFFCIGSTLCAVNDTQKTELILRDCRNNAGAFTTFHALKSKACNTNISSKVQVTGFYNETTDGTKLGEVFGANCKNYVTVGPVRSGTSALVASPADVDNNYLLHRATAPETNTLKAKISFEPKRSVWGGRIDTIIKFDSILKGLYFKTNLLVLDVKHDLNARFCDSTPGAVSPEAHTLQDILAGKSLVRTTEENEQIPLTHAKICGSHSRTGISNIDSAIGWKFLKKKNYYAGINFAWQTPTGDRPTGEFLWEPRLGSKHWGIGGGLKAGGTLWKKNNQSFKLHGKVDYRYEFEASEKRTLGLKNVLTTSPENKHIFSHYYLSGENGKYYLFPAANVLTKGVDVTPGSNIDGLLALNYNNGNFVFDIGYNIFWKERESVELNACSWKENTYGLAQKAFISGNLGTPFAITDETDNKKTINRCEIDTSVAETPSILSHTIFGGIGYIFKNWKSPLMLGLGGSYEFGDDRAAPDSWTLWLKGGFAF